MMKYFNTLINSIVRYFSCAPYTAVRQIYRIHFNAIFDKCRFQDLLTLENDLGSF